MTSFEQQKASALEKAINKIEALKKELALAEFRRKPTPLAIVGMGCNFPGEAHSPEAFWSTLVNGQNGISDVPHNRWNAEHYFSPDPNAPGKINSKKGGFLKSEVTLFDAPFFGISDIEAQSMDPQQYLLLEVVWQALENAAINPQSLKGSSSGIYIGTSTNDYGTILAKQMPDNKIHAYFGTGNSPSVLAGRVAYILGTHGPAIACDTACSSSLVAMHLACRALVEGETDLAIAGGINLILSPQNSIFFTKAGMLSEDGHCKTFDAGADGYSRGEGCGVVIIKRLNDALKANDRILCLIKGSAINQDGESSGLIVPNPEAQQQVIRQALNNSNLTPSDIDVIEAHGVGTPLSDALESEAIKAVFSNRDYPLTIGSVKTNIGHLESASGIAGVIKVILSLENEKIPKHLNFNSINPLIDLNSFKGSIPTQTKEWKQNKDRIRRAGISSFGLSGTNGHLILEEAPQDNKVSQAEHDCFLFCFSAKSAASLEDYLKTFLAFLDNPINKKLCLGDISFTLNTGRGQYKHRAALIANSLFELRSQLKKNHFLFEGDLQKMTTAEAKKALEFIQGHQVNFNSLYPYPVRKISLPYYVFQKKQYWHSILTTPVTMNAADNIHSLLQCPSYSHHHQETTYTTRLNSVCPNFTYTHQAYDLPIISNGTYISMLMSFVLHSLQKENIAIEDLEFLQPLLLKESEDSFLQLTINHEKNEFEISSFKNKVLKNAICHGSGSFVEKNSSLAAQIHLDRICPRLDKVLYCSSYSSFIEQAGLQASALSRWINKIVYNDKELIASIQESLCVEHEKYDVFPGLIDACFQALYVWQSLAEGSIKLKVPAQVKKITFSQFCSNPHYVYLVRNANNVTIKILSDNGTVLIELSSIKIKELTKSDVKQAHYFQYMNHAPCYSLDWHKADLKAFTNSGPSELNDKLLIISPEQQSYSLLKEHLAPLAVDIEKSWVNIPDLKHVLYVYPETADSNTLKELFSLHQFVQKISKMLLIQSIGVIINNSLAHSMVKGYWKTLGIECPSKRIYLIENSFKNTQLLASIIKAQCGNYGKENVVALRDGEVFVPRLVELEKDFKLSKFNSFFKYKHNRTYLITGGLNDTGKKLMQHLLTLGAQHIVLVDRYQVQELPEWFIRLQSGQNTIQYCSAEITNKMVMKTILSNIEDSNAKLAGVFHLAGECVDKLIANLARDDFELSFNAKVQGALVLDELTQSQKLDCFVLFSSIASSFGSPGQAHYAAANAFLDVLANNRRAKGLVALSINLGPLNEKSMLPSQLLKFQAMGLVPLSLDDTFTSMDYILAKTCAHVIIANFNWQQLSTFVESTAILNLISSKTKNGKSSFEALLRNTSKSNRTSLLISELKKIVAEVLFFREEQIIHEHMEFIMFGVDSLRTIALMSRLKTMIGNNYALPNGLLTEYSSIAKLSEYFKEQVFVELFDQPIRSLNIVSKSNMPKSIDRPYKKLTAPNYELKPRRQKKLTSSACLSDIFLTGATGTLGGYLSKLILESTELNLHCLIRARDEAHAFSRLRSILETFETKEHILNNLEHRVQVYCGDVSSEHFSLSSHVYDYLTNITDLTIHSAARISLRESYEELYENNVLGTKNVSKFALATQEKSLIYISSYSVMGDIQVSENPPFKESDFDLGQCFNDMGYQKTKFESERYIRAAGENGLKWRIIRPGNIFGCSKKGAYPLASEITPSIFYDLFKTVIETNVAAISQLYFDVTPVDYVAQGILHIALQQKEPFETYHLTNPDVKTFSQIIQILCELDYPIELVSAEEYIKRIYTNQLKHKGRVYQSLVTSMFQFHVAKIIPKHSTSADATKTSQLLAKAGIKCPNIDQKLLSTLLFYCIDKGYIEAKKPTLEAKEALFE